MKWNILQALVSQVQKDHNKCHKCGETLRKANFFVDSLVENHASFTQVCHVCDTQMFIETEVNLSEQSQKPLKKKALDSSVVTDLAKNLGKIRKADLRQKFRGK